MRDLLTILYDEEADAAYIRASNEPVARTEELLKDRVWIDRDADGYVVGIEFIGTRLRRRHLARRKPG